MGNSPQQPEGWNVRFTQTVEDRHFGNIDIYQNQDRTFISMVQRTFTKNGDERITNNFKKTLQFVDQCTRDNPGFMVPILHINRKQQNQLCMMYFTYEIYCQYFNFTLLDLIKHKKTLTSDELWLCFIWMLELCELLEEAKFTLQQGFSLDHIFISLKGRPIVYAHHLVPLPQIEEINDTKNNRLKEIAHSILQLACLTQLKKEENCELFLRKCEKIDEMLGEYLTKIIRNPHKYQLKDLLSEIRGEAEKDKIKKSNEIKLNKFKYIIPNAEQVRKTQPNDNDKEIPINNLQGRKKNASMRESHKKSILKAIENKDAYDFRGKDILAEIERKKKETETQKEKLSIRREKFMNSGSKENKQKVGKSVKSFQLNHRQSWTRRLISQQLKNSVHR